MPFWKFAARHGVPLLFRVEVIRDEEAGVYIATSPDLPGLVVEAETKDRLLSECLTCADALIEDGLKEKLKRPPMAAWSGGFAIA